MAKKERGRKHRGVFPYTTKTGQTRQSVRLAGPDGVMRRYGSFDTVEAAVRKRNAVLHDRDNGDLDDGGKLAARGRLLADEIAHYLTTISLKRAKRQQIMFATWWKAYFERDKILRLIDVKPEHIETARAFLLAHGAADLSPTAPVRRKSKGVTPSTVNRYTDWLRRLFNVARKQGRHFRDNPVTALDRFRESRGTPQPYSADQRAKLLAALGEVDGEMFILAILTNMRQADQFQLRKDYLDLDVARCLILPRTKNNEPRVVPLSVWACELLRRQIARTPPDCPWVYPGSLRRGPDRTFNPLNARWWYNVRFKPACVTAGIPVDRIRHLWHSARDTFGSTLAELGYSDRGIKDAGGWLTSAAAGRYIALCNPTIREAMERLAAYLQVQSGTAIQLPAPDADKPVKIISH